MPSILVVDDDVAVVEMLTELLIQAGYSADHCGDGAKVFEALRARDYDLMILDVLMPGTNGFQVLEQLRADPVLCGLKVVVISGIYRRRNHHADAISKYGVIDFLDKPFAPEHILAIIATAVGHGEPSTEGPSVTTDPAINRILPKRRLTGAPHEPENEDLVDRDAVAERAQVENESRSGFRQDVFSLQGTIDDNPVPMILGRLWHGRRKGALLLRRDKLKKIIYVNEGSAYAVKSNKVSECLGQVLLRERVITEDECARSLQLMEESGKKQGETLVGMHAITEKNLDFALALQLETKLFETFAWDRGEFRFNPAAELPPAHSKLEWAGAAIVTEGIRRAFDETRLRGEMMSTFHVSVGFRQSVLNFDSLGLTPQERAAIIAFELPTPPRQLIEDCRLAPPDTLRIIYTLIALELLGPKS